jgi:predicted ATPase
VPTNALEAAGYTLVQALYRSDRTEVVRARRVDPERAVVLKIVRPGTKEADHARRRLEHEYAVLQQLAGLPGVARATELVPTAHGPALELLDDGASPLAARLDAPWPLDAFFEVARGLVRVVAGVHQRGFIHRDLTPSNVLLGPGGPVLVDFALATPLDSVRPELRQLTGTLGYLAPEQTGRMNRLVDWRADLYSIGALLFEMLAGRPALPVVDPLAALHATVARAPPSLTVLRPDLPPVLAEIVGVLLNKMAEERYQTAYGLLDDLDQCAFLHRTEGRVARFPLRSRDRSARFQLPDRLYGREAESASLRAALQRASAGEAVLVGVRGSAGVGKTALALELLREVSLHGGLFSEGKFDALRRSEPHACLIDALRRLLRSLLGEHGDRARWWRVRLAESLSGAAPVLADSLPELVELLGPQPALAEARTADGRRRFHEAMEQLLRALSSPREPLVLFLDDVQWADRATLDLLQQALTSWQRGSVLLVLAWREEELAPTDPLVTLLARLPAGMLQAIDVGPLSEEGVAELIRDALGCSVEGAAAFAKVVHQKTGGNVFFVREFLLALHTRREVTFEPAERRWVWDVESVRRVSVTANVVDLVLVRLRALPAETTRLLAMAACRGATVDAEQVLQAADRPRSEVARGLVRLMEERLLEPLGEVFDDLNALATGRREGPVAGGLRFPHDRVQEAALALLPPGERQAIHLRLGRMMLASGEPERDPFPVLDQLNRALDGIDRPEERLTVARLNLAAGKRARRSGAFDAALAYLEAGLSLVPGEGWDQEYELTMALHLEASDAALLVPDRKGIRPYAELALQRARGVLHRVAAQEARIRGDLASSNNEGAVRRCLEALGWLGVRVSDNPSMARIGLDLVKNHLRIRRMDRAALAALPVSQDPEAQAAMRLLMLAASPAYYVSSRLSSAILLALVSLSLDRGVTKYSAYGFQAWAFLLASVFGDVDQAERVGTFGRSLVERLDAPDLSCRVDTLYLGFVRARRDSWHSVVDAYLDAHLSGIEHGDAEYAALAAYNHATFAFLAGQPLRVVAARAEAMERVVVRLGQERNRWALAVLRQVVANLRGEAPDPAKLDGTHVQSEAFVREMEASHDRAGLAVAAVYRTALLVRLGLPAAEAADEADDRMQDIPGSPHLSYHAFHAALARIAAHRATGGGLGKVAPLLRQLRVFAATAPANHAHQVLLRTGCGRRGRTEYSPTRRWPRCSPPGTSSASATTERPRPISSRLARR